MSKAPPLATNSRASVAIQPLASLDVPVLGNVTPLASSAVVVVALTVVVGATVVVVVVVVLVVVVAGTGSLIVMTMST